MIKSRDPWRNGSAFDSRSKGYPFKSGVVQNLIIQPMILTWEFILLHSVGPLAYSFVASACNLLDLRSYGTEEGWKSVDSMALCDCSAPPTWRYGLAQCQHNLISITTYRLHNETSTLLLPLPLLSLRLLLSQFATLPAEHFLTLRAVVIIASRRFSSVALSPVARVASIGVVVDCVVGALWAVAVLGFGGCATAAGADEGGVSAHAWVRTG